MNSSFDNFWEWNSLRTKYRRIYNKIIKTQCKTDLRSELFQLFSEKRKKHELCSSLIIILSRFSSAPGQSILRPPLLHSLVRLACNSRTPVFLHSADVYERLVITNNFRRSFRRPSISPSAIFVSYKVPSAKKKKKNEAIKHRFSTFVYFFSPRSSSSSSSSFSSFSFSSCFS